MTQIPSALDAFEFTAFVTECAQLVLHGLKGDVCEKRLLPDVEGLTDRLSERDGLIDFGARENRAVVDGILPVCGQLIAAAESRGRGDFVRGLFTYAGLSAIERGTVFGFRRAELAALDPCFFGQAPDAYEKGRRFFH